MIRTDQHDGFRIAMVDSPPLGAANRRTLLQALDSAVRDSAIVIRGAGRLFSNGADIKKLSNPPSDPSLPDQMEADRTASYAPTASPR